MASPLGLARQIIGNWFPPPARFEQEELLDLGAGTREDAQRNLREMQRINDWFGGTRALTDCLLPLLSQHQRPVSVLDLGTGMAGMPALLVRRGPPGLTVTGVDRSKRCLVAAQRCLVAAQRCLVAAQCCPAAAKGEVSGTAVRLVQADARSLPFVPGQFDYVISSLFLHHFKPKELADLLRSAFEIARCGVVMSDLVRGRLPIAAFRLIQPVFARSFLTRQDGELSIRRAYTPGELAGLAAEAGLGQARIICRWPWRMTLVAEK